MIQAFISAFWPYVWHMSAATLAMVACGAWAIWGPFLKKEAIYLGVGIFFTTFAYVVGVSDGKHIVQTLWDAAIKRDVGNANKTRDSIERGLPDVIPPRELCNDPDNRDRGNC